MNESQRAMVAGKLANITNGENQHTMLGSANWQSDMESSAHSLKVSQTEAAKLLNVSERSVARAKKVQDKAVPESWRI